MRFFVPEVVQTSAMDCGPAALKAACEGFGVSVSYGRLREACQTGLDGTCIDTIEIVANELGLAAEQIMLPVDHVVVPEAHTLPAVVVVQLPSGVTHFVVVWRRHGPFLQVMDPGVGRRWIRCSDFVREVYAHRMAVDAQGWREFATSEEFSQVLRERMQKIGVPRDTGEQLRSSAAQDDSWRPLAALDASVRTVNALIVAGALKRSETLRCVQGLLKDPELIPKQYWSVQPADADEHGAEQVFFRGAVLIRIRAGIAKPELSGLAASVVEKRAGIRRELFECLRAAGWFGIATLAGSVLVAGAMVVVESLLFRAIFDVAGQLHLPQQRIALFGAAAGFVAVALGLELAVARGFVRVGRILETQLRVRFLRKIPRLGDRYFQSRLMSDMAERSHSMHRVRAVANIARQGTTATVRLLAIASALIVLQPDCWVTVLAIVAAALLPPLLTRSLLVERDLQVRSHASGLTRFYLDAMLGLLAIRAHGAERRVLGQQEKLLGAWASSALSSQRIVAAVDGAQTFVMFGLVALLISEHPYRSFEIGRVLLLAYWSLNLPALGQTIAGCTRRYPYVRNLILRLLEPLGAPEEEHGPICDAAIPDAPSVRFEKVSVQASGHSLLEDVDIEIGAGEHVAVVGPSGAGKSTLIGCLLGWSRPFRGHILVDGKSTDPATLRRRAAWVDPTVQLWNRSLLDNVTYGTGSSDKAAEAIEAALLRSVLETLPAGMQTVLGEGGALVSGGEGQRVRLARAMLKPDAGLVLLDEPFRGLDRDKRRELMSRARTLWRDSTLLCATHDIAETLAFDRVLVVEGGRVVEQGAPSRLLADPRSRYSQLKAAETRTRLELWSGSFWRRFGLQQGHVTEAAPIESEMTEVA